MKYFSPFVIVAATAAMLAAPALAHSSFVQDGAGMFGATTVSDLNTRLSNFNAQTHKEVVVVTVPSLNGATLTDAAQREFSQQQVNGVMIFIAKDDRRDIIVPDRAGVQAGWFDAETLRSIRESMESQFKDGNFDAGITSAVSGVLGIYRSHMSSLNGAGGAALPATRSYNGNAVTTPGFHLNGFWLIIILIAAFLILRSIMRAMSAPRYIGTPGAPGARGPAGGYGPGYYGGGGGGFWSGLLGGLGGAWLGNEMFRGGGGGSGGGASAGGWGGGDAGGGGADSGGWSSDAGQADIAGSSGGDWSGGGFGDGGGGGDFGGGGGGGDSGGGW